MEHVLTTLREASRLLREAGRFVYHRQTVAQPVQNLQKQVSFCGFEMNFGDRESVVNA